MWEKHKSLEQTLHFYQVFWTILHEILWLGYKKFFPLIDKRSSVFFSGPVKLFISLISRVLNCKNRPQLRGITLKFGFYRLLWQTRLRAHAGLRVSLHEPANLHETGGQSTMLEGATSWLASSSITSIMDHQLMIHYWPNFHLLWWLPYQNWPNTTSTNVALWFNEYLFTIYTTCTYKTGSILSAWLLFPFDCTLLFISG